ncbi:contractile injection system tape measure protein [Serratia sp. Je.1.23.a]|uniref:contractile injection system tape measure protein n=1 Tax=Serratia sp. Je.1.23.a TaxID=3142841 RepID=UPI003DAA12FA
MRKVILARLRFRLHTQERYAEAIQARCSLWFRDELMPELRVLFADCAEGETRTIERLTVNVGEVPLSQFESIMQARILSQLKEQLFALPAPVRQVPGASMRQAAWQHGAVEGLTTAAKIATEKDGSQGEGAMLPASFTQLLHYLDTGVVMDARPWLFQAGRDVWLRESLDSATTVQEGGRRLSPRIALAVRLLQPRARQRLITSWPGQVLSHVSAWLLTSRRLPSMPSSDAVWMLPLAALLALRHHPVASDYVWALPTRPVVSSAPVPFFGDTGVDPVAGFAVVTTGTSAVGENVPSMGREPPNIRTFEAWLVALFDGGMPDDLQGPLMGWLCGATPDSRPPATYLSGVSASVRRQLQATCEPLLMPTPRPLALTPDVRSTERVAVAGTERSMPLPAARRITESDEPRIVAGAGVVVLWPLLPSLFDQFGWLEEGRFVDDESRWHAVACLDWLTWGEAPLAEWRTPCTRLLCGIDPDVPFDAVSPSLLRQAELDDWLGRALITVPLLDRCSGGDIRSFFLQRTGTLVDEPMSLTIEPDAPDVLLSQLPWPLTNVMLPWLSAPVRVNWVV